MRHILFCVGLFVAAVGAQAQAQALDVHIGAGIAPLRDGSHVVGAIGIVPTRTVSLRADLILEQGEYLNAVTLGNVVVRTRLFSRTIYGMIGAGVALDNDLPLAGSVGVGIRLRDVSIPMAIEGRVLAAPDEHFLLGVMLRL